MVFTDGLLIMTIIAMVIHLINKRLVVQKAVLPQKYVLLFSKIRSWKTQPKKEYENSFDEEAANIVEVENKISAPNPIFLSNLLRIVSFVCFSLTTLVLIVFFIW